MMMRYSENKDKSQNTSTTLTIVSSDINQWNLGRHKKGPARCNNMSAIIFRK